MTRLGAWQTSFLIIILALLAIFSILATAHFYGGGAARGGGNQSTFLDFEPFQSALQSLTFMKNPEQVR